MDRSRRALIRLVFVLVALIPALVSAQTILTGQTASGAYYQIAVPPGWQPADGLVIWNHGFTLNPPGPNPSLGPLSDLQLAEGYAVAASSYSLNGWALFQTLTDNRQLYQTFVDNVGVPDQVLVTGGSLGGIVTAQAIEEGGVGNVVGALPVCGALGGSRIWNGAVDVRLLYDFVCQDVPGAHIPGGAGGLPSPPDPAFDNNAMAGAVHTCTGILAPPELRTPEQQANLDRLLGGLRFARELPAHRHGICYVRHGQPDPGPGKARRRHAVRHLERRLRRRRGQRGRRARHRGPDRRATFPRKLHSTGRVGATKIVSLHTDKDGLV